MMKCNICNNERITLSNKSSKLISNLNYAACSSCGNIMLVVNENTIVPTPTSKSVVTKVLIQDASDCFSTAEETFDEKAINCGILETQNIDLIQRYISTYLDNLNQEKEYDHIDCDCDDQEDECVSASQMDNESDIKMLKETFNGDNEISMTLAEVAFASKGENYLLILPSGEKQIYMNTSKDFVINIINDIGSHMSLYRLNEIKLKQEVRYSF